MPEIVMQGIYPLNKAHFCLGGGATSDLHRKCSYAMIA